MRPVSLPLLVIALLLSAAAAGAQQPLILIVADTPCDSLTCASIVVATGRPAPTVLTSFRFRDGVMFSLDSAALGADTIAAGAPVTVPVCFRPTRRGQITDSLTVVATSGATSDTFRLRLTGRGIGPELEPTPFALNFPKTDVGNSSTIAVTLRNVGERPYTFDASSITLPAPFQLATPGPIVIPPGGSISIDVVFAPPAAGVYSEEAELRAGCTRRLQLGLNGATELIGTGSVLRVSKVLFNPVNDEETPCSIARCTDVTVSNVGNAPLTIEQIRWALDTAGYRVTNLPSLPLLIAPNSQRTFEVCLEGRWRGRLHDTLVIESNSRASIAFGMVIDFSESMNDTMGCGPGFTPPRYTQAILQAQRFIGRTLLHLPAVDIQDQLAVMRYSYDTEIRMLFPLQPVTEPLKTAAQGVLSGQRPSNCRFRVCTFTGAAISQMLDTLVKATIDRRVLVLLSDGGATDDTIANPQYTADALAARARALGITIFTIGLGTSDNVFARTYLERLANGTGGTAYSSNSCDSLQQAFEDITVRVSRGHITREPFAMRVTAPMVISSGDLTFDSTYYRETSCREVTLTNIGEGDVVIDSIALRDALGATTGEFFFGPGVSFPLRIPESGQLGVEICFRPNGLRQRAGQTSFSFNSCQTLIIGSRLSGTGWATAAMRIDDERAGLPGTIATMPVHLDSTLAAFEVGTVTFQVRWNKSMLDLRAIRPLAALGGGAVALAGPVRYEGRDAVVDIVATGDFLAGAGPLAELELLVLRGDSLASEVRLSSLSFEDGNPKPLMRNAGLVAFDSTCFRDFKAIALGGATAKLVAVSAAPVPARRGEPLTLSLRSEGSTSLRIRVYSPGGAIVAPALERTVAAGEERVVLPTDELSPGAYFVQIEDGAGVTHVRSVVVAE